MSWKRTQLAFPETCGLRVLSGNSTALICRVIRGLNLCRFVEETEDIVV